jgi:Mannosyl-glycoprotein endo-beta-N-acetylglucosaminidase
MTSGKITRRRPRAIPLVAVLAFAAVTTVAAPAGADTSSPTSSTSSPTVGVMSNDALVQAVQLALEYTTLTAQLAQVSQTLAVTQRNLAAAQNSFEVLDVRLGNDENALRDAVVQLHARAVVSYERNKKLIGAALEVQHVQSLTVGEHYAEAASSADTKDVTRLQADVTQFKDERDRRAVIVRGLQAQLTELNVQHDVLSARAASDQSALQALGGVPVLGTSRLTAPQLADWFRSTGAHAHLSGTATMGELAQLYIEEGTAAGVRGDIAFAQAIIETGSFGHATDNNYAGIGACDSCTGEPSFPTPRAGVRAQVQLLRSYADPASTAATLENPPDPTLFGADPLAATAAFDHFFLKGKVPLWNQMGHGNWATDPNYAGKVLRIYAGMLAFAAQHG